MSPVQFCVMQFALEFFYFCNENWHYKCKRLGDCGFMYVLREVRINFEILFLQMSGTIRLMNLIDFLFNVKSRLVFLEVVLSTIYFYFMVFFRILNFIRLEWQLLHTCITNIL